MTEFTVWAPEAARLRLPGSIRYELHVGAFTPEGTFDAAIGHLDHLVDLGVDLVELLPANAFDGGPDGLRRLVDAVHAKGLGMILDVAHYRFGHRHLGDSLLRWLRDYHVDGLRLGGVPATPGARPGAELTAAVESLSAHLGRPLSLIAEPDLNGPAQHALPTLLTEDRVAQQLSAGLLRVGATLLMTALLTPMLFMGEEWAAGTPRQFAAYGRPAGEIPDRRTLVRGRLDWAELDKPEHREVYDFYRRLIAVRKSRPDLSDPRSNRIDVRHGDRFLLTRRGECLVAANLAGKPQRINLPGLVRTVLLATATGVTVMRDGIELPPESAAIVAL
ncbi:DUF3459 domain-containing protein [Micromonospora eburnea]|uniref:DUF3459 domain-containing protein n=1 Tax=Micromonospora eburnea TaxID=227316 RepID=UPI000B2ADF4F|nr:DUF3459 domain-containing protein [Micromonospora eburnea]